MSTSAEELSEWFDDTSFYSSVSFSDGSLAAIQNLMSDANSHVALWVRTRMINAAAAK